MRIRWMWLFTQSVAKSMYCNAFLTEKLIIHRITATSIWSSIDPITMTKDFAIEAKIWNENDSIHLLPSDIHKQTRKRFENPQDKISWQNKIFTQKKEIIKVQNCYPCTNGQAKKRRNNQNTSIEHCLPAALTQLRPYVNMIVAIIAFGNDICKLMKLPVTNRNSAFKYN